MQDIRANFADNHSCSIARGARLIENEGQEPACHASVFCKAVCDLYLHANSASRFLLSQAVHAELHLHMLVEVLCFGDWHLNKHHIERHVCLDCGCIGLFGCEAVHSIEPLCMEPAGSQTNTAMLLVLHWLPKLYTCIHTRSSDTLCTRRSHLSFCCHASLQHKGVSNSMLSLY